MNPSKISYHFCIVFLAFPFKKVTCPITSMMMYTLPMLLGRTYDMNTNTIGIDIYNKEDIERALHHPTDYSEVVSDYVQISDLRDKRESLGISAELALKISSGLFDFKGAGEYFKGTSHSNKFYEVLVRTTFKTVFKEIDIRAEPMEGWQNMKREMVGTHVVTSIQYGGELYASIKFIALADSFIEEIKAEVKAALSKSGAFNLEAEGQLHMLTKNLSSKAKIEIDYYSTVPLVGVPTTLKGLIDLVRGFQDHVEKVNHGIGVPICVGFRSLSSWDDRFSFVRNMELQDTLDDFNERFNQLREAKFLLKRKLKQMPDNVPRDYMNKLIDFYGRLRGALAIFYDTIAKLDLQQGTYQLHKAMDAFDMNMHYELKGNPNGYILELKEKIGHWQLEDYHFPRGIYTEWGSKNCSNPSSHTLYNGFMTTHLEHALGGGPEYLCLPEKPDLNLPPSATSKSSRSAKIAGVRYHSMNLFHNKHIDSHVVPCAVCDTTARPTVEVIPGILSCPLGWMKEYAGYLVSTANDRARGDLACITTILDMLSSESGPAMNDPIILPVMASHKGDNDLEKGASIPCFVCSK